METSASSSLDEALQDLVDLDLGDLAKKADSSLFFLHLRAFSRALIYMPWVWVASLVLRHGFGGSGCGWRSWGAP
jgi:hypothetical protein